jgi:hypothetical protein
VTKGCQPPSIFFPFARKKSRCKTRERARTHTLLWWMMLYIMHTSAENPAVFLLELSRARKKGAAPDQYRMQHTTVRARGSTSVARGCTWCPFVTKGKQDRGSCGRSSARGNNNSGTTLAPTTSFRSVANRDNSHLATSDSAFTPSLVGQFFSVQQRAQQARRGGFPFFLAGSRAPFQTTCSYPTRISGVATVDEE